MNEMREPVLTAWQAFQAMYTFIDDRNSRLQSADLAMLLSESSLLPDGATADPASWEDWLAAVDKVLSGSAPDQRLRLTKEDVDKSTS
jgi:hypothetical protein